MLERSASVVQTDDGRLWLETQPRSACSGCSSDGCTASVLSKLFGSGKSRFPLEAGLDLKVGQEVLIGIPDELLVQASIWAYLIPLMVMIPAAALAALSGAGEGLQSLCAIGGLITGFVLVRWVGCSVSSQRRLAPRLLRVAGAPAQELPIPHPVRTDIPEQ